MFSRLATHCKVTVVCSRKERASATFSRCPMARGSGYELSTGWGQANTSWLLSYLNEEDENHIAARRAAGMSAGHDLVTARCTCWICRP